MKALGVKAVISPCAAGSLQLSRRARATSSSATSSSTGRTAAPTPSTTDPIVSHVSSADIYDPELRRIAIEVIREHDIPVHERGTVVVIQGPRFSTKSESKWFSDAGWEVINMTQYPEAYLCRELGMAVVNISLITDYDAGVHEGTEAVNAMSVLEVFELNAARIQKVVLDMIRRFPADLDALGAADMLKFTRGDGHAISRRGHPAVRDRARSGADRLPIGVCIRTIRATPDWWLEQRPTTRRRRATPASGPGITSSARATGPSRSSRRWTILSAAAATTRRVTVGTFVVNVMNRHPAVLARMADDAPGGQRRTARPRDRDRRPPGRAPGARDPVPGRARAGRPARGGGRRHPRRCGAGGPVTRPSPFYPLDDAVASPVPDPPPPIVIGGETRTGARLAGRIGDGWTAFEDNFEANLPVYLEALEASGRRRADQLVIVGFQGRDWLSDETLAGDPWVEAPRETWARWQAAGADGAIVTVRTTADVDALVAATDRW